MSTDLGKYRVIINETNASPSKEDWYQQIVTEHPSVADAIRETLLASDFAPQNTADLAQWVTTLTAAAVTCYYETLPDGTILASGTKLTNIQLTTATGLVTLTDSLAVYNLFAPVDPSLSITTARRTTTGNHQWKLAA